MRGRLSSVGLHATADEISISFDAGNYGSAYTSTDLEVAWRKAKKEHKGTKLSRPAFVLGFFSTFEPHEVPGDYADEYAEAWGTDDGRAVVAAGYVDPPESREDWED